VWHNLLALVADALEADTFINVPIGKTHGMAG